MTEAHTPWRQDLSDASSRYPFLAQASDVQAEASLLLIQLACEDSVLP